MNQCEKDLKTEACCAFCHAELSEAKNTIIELTGKVERYEKALRQLSALGGGRSEGNCIAQEALKK